MLLKKRNIKLLTIITVLSFYVGVPGFCFLFFHPEKNMKFIRIEGEPVGKYSNSVRTFIERKTMELLSRKITLEFNGNLIPVSLKELGFVPDIEKNLKTIRKLTEYQNDPFTTLNNIFNMKKGKVNLPVVLGLDDKVIEKKLLELKEKLDVYPVNAKVIYNENGFKIQPEKTGILIDLYGSINEIEKAVVDRRHFFVNLPAVKVNPAISGTDLTTMDFSKILSSFETRFFRSGTSNSARAHNIELAAEKINGTIVMPGSIFSFNKIVGERSESNGFIEAPEIYEGQMVTGTGGGVCQVASTVYAACYLGGLDIVERTHHSRPGSYIPLGLDATVTWPSIDLKVRNPYPFPLMIKAEVVKNKLIIQLLGNGRPVKVAISKKILNEIPFDKNIAFDSELPPNVTVTEQKGINGYLLKKIRKITFGDGRSKLETSIDYYPPTTQITRINNSTGQLPVENSEGTSD